MSKAASAAITVTVRQTPISYRRLGDRDRPELLAPAGAVDSCRLVERGVDLVMPVSSRTVQKPSRTQTPMRPTAGSAVSKSPSQARVTSPRPIAVRTWLIKTGQGQQPAPDDAGRDQRDDLGQEEDRPRRPSRSLPLAIRWITLATTSPSVTGMKLKKKHEAEGVEERLDEVGIAEDGRVVRRARPTSPGRCRPSGRTSTGPSGRAAAARTPRT